MSTSPVIIERVRRWLEYFTLAELVFILTEEARTSPLDKGRRWICQQNRPYLKFLIKPPLIIYG